MNFWVIKTEDLCKLKGSPEADFDWFLTLINYNKILTSYSALSPNPNLPNLSADEVRSAIPNSEDVSFLGNGGQKIVFKAKVNSTVCVLKFSLVPSGIDPATAPLTEVGKRAAREVDVLGRCPSVHMVKLGPIGLSYQLIAGQQTLFFSEEFIDGKDLKKILVDEGHQSVSQAVKLALDVIDATEAMRVLGIIHRDIKPGNIMRRSSDGSYILLDAGVAFDLFDASISSSHSVGTCPYYSPEQFDYTNKRNLDHRSDMFSLGTTLYEALTQKNPFFEPGDNYSTIATKIMSSNPLPPSRINSTIPPALDSIIMQMLGKAPYERFRSFDLLTKALTPLK